jgi:hypothetical protein
MKLKIIEVINYEKTSFTPPGCIPFNVPSGAGQRFQPDYRPGGATI